MHVSSVAEGSGCGESQFPNHLWKVIRTFCVVWLVSGIYWGLASGQTQDLRQKRELELWQGNWRAVTGERDGQLRPKGFLDALTVTVQGDVMTMQVGKRQQSLRLVLDPTVRPKAVDLVHLEGKEQGEVWLGIYQLESDRLKLCAAPPGSPRPDDFLTRPGSGRELLILQRRSAGSKTPP